MNIEFDKTRKSICQGDMYLIPIVGIPDDAKPMSAENGAYIITHSETGHHHVVKERPDIKQFSGMDQFRGYLTLDEPALLEHLREHHTHAPQVVPAGAWLIQRQAAYTPQGWERARD
jgi:hypothetical protein